MTEEEIIENIHTQDFPNANVVDLNKKIKENEARILSLESK